MSYLSALQAGAFSGTSGVVPTLSQVLLTTAGNIASTDINMAQNGLLNVETIQNATEPIIIGAPEGISLSGSVGTAGQVLTSNATAQPTWTTLGGVGTSTQVLTLNSSLVPTWATPTSGSTPTVTFYSDSASSALDPAASSGTIYYTFTNLPAGTYSLQCQPVFSVQTVDLITSMTLYITNDAGNTPGVLPYLTSNLGYVLPNANEMPSVNKTIGGGTVATSFVNPTTQTVYLKLLAFVNNNITGVSARLNNLSYYKYY